MNKSNYNFEAAIMIISAAIIMLFIINHETFFVALIWQFLLGIIQLIHALALSFNPDNNTELKKYMKYYWVVVIVYLVAAAGLHYLGWDNDGFLAVFMIAPWGIALYFFYITYKFTRPFEEDNQIGVEL